MELSNPNNWYINDVMDHVEDSKGHEFALRGDGEYDFHTDWLDSLKFGGRYADRKQLLQWSTYNWHNVSNTWTGNCAYTYFNLDSKPATCTSAARTPTSPAIRPDSTRSSRSVPPSSAAISVTSRSFRSISSLGTGPICSAPTRPASAVSFQFASATGSILRAAM